ncbi:hypothetical protein FRB99_005669 [Tulasnella sp. 403]|nr:hypothetical protein FRB99_005669 [Tulasnella sp. 403]
MHGGRSSEHTQNVLSRNMGDQSQTERMPESDLMASSGEETKLGRIECLLWTRSDLTTAQVAAIRFVVQAKLESADGEREMCDQLVELMDLHVPCWRHVEIGSATHQECNVRTFPEGEWAGHVARTISSYAGELQGNADPPRPFAFPDRLEHLLEKHALLFSPRDKGYYTVILWRLAIHKRDRFRRLQNVDDLNRYIDYYQRTLTTDLPSVAQRCDIMFHIAAGCMHRHTRLGQVSDLNITIEMCEALIIADPNLSMMYQHLCNLATSLMHRFDCGGDITDLDCAIIAGHDAIEEIPPSKEEDRLLCFANLATAYSRRFSYKGVFADLSKAIGVFEEAMASTARPPAALIQNFAIALVSRYRLLGAASDLDTAIEYFERSVKLWTRDDFDGNSSINDLAATLVMRFEDRGDISDLNRAITCYRQLLSKLPVGSLGRRYCLGNLADALRVRYHHLDNVSDLDTSIYYNVQVLNLHPEGHPERHLCLNNLAIALMTRFHCTRNVSDLDACIACHKEVLRTTSTSNPNRTRTLNNFGMALRVKYGHTHDLEDLNRAIEGLEMVLADLTGGDPTRPVILFNLGDAFEERYGRTNDPDDLDRCIQYRQDGIRFCPSSHPKHCTFLRRLTGARFRQIKVSGKTASRMEIQSLVDSLGHAAGAVASPSVDRLGAACEWATYARGYKQSCTMKAYEAMLDLLDVAVARDHSLEDRHASLASLNVLRTAKRLVVEAAAYAIERGDPMRAVEFLEHGRAVVLGQLSRYRTPVAELRAVNPTLADRLSELGRQLEGGASAQKSVTRGEFEDDISRYQRVSIEWNATLSEIRSLAGFETFLQPTPFSVLQEAAAEGPVIVVNIAAGRSDALIVCKKGVPVVVDLAAASAECVSNMTVQLTRALSQPGGSKREREISGVLRDVWEIIVKPIVDALQEKLCLPRKSRIWWCPTAGVSRLPLHAAGNYARRDENVADLYISSYTPTLGALIRGRRGAGSRGVGGMLVVGQGDTPGQVALPAVREEIERIQERVPDARVVEGSNGTLGTVLRGVTEHSWVHFSCHGHINHEQPFRSHFALHDEPLHVLDLVEQRLPNAELAVLSACHSAAGDRYTPDEFVHLAAAMQFAGFQGVVGTMWAMADVDGPTLASEFYKDMIKKGGKRKGSGNVAAALRKAVKEMRKAKVPLSRWVNFVHFGV